MPGQLALRLAGGSCRGEDLLVLSVPRKPSHSGSPAPSAEGALEGGGAVGSGGGPRRHQGEGREPGGWTASPSGGGRERAWQKWAELGGTVSQEQVGEDSGRHAEEAGFYSKGAGKGKLPICVLEITASRLNGRTRRERTGNRGIAEATDLLWPTTDRSLHQEKGRMDMRGKVGWV